MEKLGQLLKAEREKRSLSLHEIGMSLKINPKILKAIEENDTANLPAKTFLRGFVRSYAQYLRLDVDQALKMFQSEYGGGRVEEVKVTSSTTDNSSSETSAPISTPAPVRFEKPLKKNEDIALPKQSGGRWIQIFAAVFILVTIAFVVKMIDKYQKESEIEETAIPVTSPIEATTTTLEAITDPLSTPVSTTVPEGMMSSPAGSTTSSTLSSATTTSILAVVSSSTTTSTTTTMKPTATTVKIIAPTTTTSTTTTTVKGTTTSTTTVKPSTTTTLAGATTTSLASKNTEVIVEALNAVQIKYTLGDDSAKSMELKPDQIHTFKSRSKVLLEVSDGGAINVIVNGRDRGVPGTIGRSLKLTYP